METIHLDNIRRVDLHDGSTSKQYGKLKGLFNKLGLVSWILPYIGNFKKWEKFMYSLCKSTKDLWTRNFKAFKGLEIHIMSAKIIFTELLKKYRIDDNPSINEDYLMDWNLIRYKDQIHDLLKEISLNKYKNYRNYGLRRLNINVLCKFSQDGISDLKYYFTNMSPMSLKILSIDGGMKDISIIIKSLVGLLKGVKEEIYLYGFDFSYSNVLRLIENSSSVQCLRLVNGYLIKHSLYEELKDKSDVMKDDFELSPKVKYCIEELDLSNTYAN